MKNKTKGKDIYVTDISFDAGEEDLKKLFSVCGTVRSVHLLTDARTGNFNGRAFVCMASDAETKEAINMLDGTRLINRCISVCATREKPAAEPFAATEKRPRQRRQPKGRRK
ncbi:MAG: RNA-binding protein [Deltaproteobacteria bacterium]|nr:RNA-binding protein [Deltaproteobacteria bacterium]